MGVGGGSRPAQGVWYADCPFLLSTAVSLLNGIPPSMVESLAQRNRFNQLFACSRNMRREMTSGMIRKAILVLIAAALFCFNPLRLILWPESGAYYLDLVDILLSFSVILFPIAGSVILALVIRPSANSRLTALRNTFLASLAVASIVWFFVVMLPLNWATLKKMESFTAAYKNELRQVREQVISAREVAWSNSVRFESPHIMLEYTSESGELPRDPHAISNHHVQWYGTVFGEDIRRELATYGPLPEELPEFKCATAYLVVYTQEKSGRMIALDIGSVPEFLWYAEVYAVNLEAKTRAKLPGRVYGPEAETPAKQPGGGVRYVSSLSGERPSCSSIQDHIDSTVNH